MRNIHRYVDEMKAEEAGHAKGTAPAANWPRTWSSMAPPVPPARRSVEETQCSALRLSRLVQARAATFPGLLAPWAPERVSVKETQALCP